MQGKTRFWRRRSVRWLKQQRVRLPQCRDAFPEAAKEFQPGSAAKPHSSLRPELKTTRDSRRQVPQWHARVEREVTPHWYLVLRPLSIEPRLARRLRRSRGRPCIGHESDRT